MNAQEKMKIVDNLFNDIADRVGILSGYGVFSFEGGAEIIKAFSDKQMEWMKSKFSDAEINEFIKHNIL